MGESQGNPFIGNPFMQKGMQTDKTAPPMEREPQSRHKDSEELPLAAPDQLSESSTAAPKKTAKSAKAAKTISKSTTTKTTAKTAAKSTAAKSTAARTSSKRKRTSHPPVAPSPAPAYSGNGYNVQVLAKIPMPSNPTMPSRDYLWFAVYPIIPRVGDCIFHDGRYFRVDAVFLYENTNAGWCADLEVSYYTRRH